MSKSCQIVVILVELGYKKVSNNIQNPEWSRDLLKATLRSLGRNSKWLKVAVTYADLAAVGLINRSEDEPTFFNPESLEWISPVVSKKLKSEHHLMWLRVLIPPAGLVLHPMRTPAFLPGRTKVTSTKVPK